MAQQPRLLAENRSVDALRITQGTPTPSWPGDTAVLGENKKMCRPPCLGYNSESEASVKYETNYMTHVMSRSNRPESRAFGAPQVGEYACLRFLGGVCGSYALTRSTRSKASEASSSR